MKELEKLLDRIIQTFQSGRQLFSGENPYPKFNPLQK
jgi:hypothetical protein